MGFLDKTRVLKIAGAILDSNQLENYLEKLASDHIIKKNSKVKAEQSL